MPVDSPSYLFAMALLIFFWGTAHFYFVHRLLHWRPLYRLAHQLHHRNVNVCPWSGISMHPIEHVLYFSALALWCVLPAHPIIAIAAGFYFGLGPAFSHCGFERVNLPRKKSLPMSLPTGDYFHQLHHRHFNVNYGNTPTPLDKVFGSWRSG